MYNFIQLGSSYPPHMPPKRHPFDQWLLPESQYVPDSPDFWLLAYCRSVSGNSPGARAVFGERHPGVVAFRFKLLLLQFGINFVVIKFVVHFVGSNITVCHFNSPTCRQYFFQIHPFNSMVAK
jgi:hypothetical protein